MKIQHTPPDATTETLRAYFAPTSVCPTITYTKYDDGGEAGGLLVYERTWRSRSLVARRKADGSWTGTKVVPRTEQEFVNTIVAHKDRELSSLPLEVVSALDALSKEAAPETTNAERMRVKRAIADAKRNPRARPPHEDKAAAFLKASYGDQIGKFWQVEPLPFDASAQLTEWTDAELVRALKMFRDIAIQRNAAGVIRAFEREILRREDLREARIDRNL
jgi:hypothetical protein